MNANDPKKQRKLRNFLIVPGYQLRYVALLNVVSVAMLAASYFGLRTLYRDALSTCAEYGVHAEDFAPIVFGFGLFFLAFTSLLGIYFSHRTAGPMYRFEKVFRSIRNGNLSERIHLRPNDDFKNVAEAFNALMDQIAPQSATRSSNTPPPSKK